MRLIAIARSIQPFLKKKYDLNAVFKELMDNNNLDFLNKVVPLGEDFIILTFLSYKILQKETVDESTISEIKNNLFLYNVIEFEGENSHINCDVCDGNGSVDCSYCDGSGKEECGECDGDGTVSCPECDGEGESEDGEKCDECNGQGNVDCDNCGGEGSTDCSYCEYGNEDCENCNGRGEIATSDYVPYTVSVYASYNTKLKDKIEHRIQRMKDGVFDNSNSLLVWRRDYPAGEGQTELINHDFQEKTYYDQIIDTDINSNIKGLEQVYKAIRVPLLMDPSEKFED